MQNHTKKPITGLIKKKKKVYEFLALKNFGT
jgi:hypothetical protein